MENMNADQVLNWALIGITLLAVTWAALQNWFFNSRNRYNQYPPPWYPPYGGYPPPYLGGHPQQGGDYPQFQTPRSSSPILTLVVIIIAGIIIYRWVKSVDSSPEQVKQNFQKEESFDYQQPQEVRMVPGDYGESSGENEEVRIIEDTLQSYDNSKVPGRVLTSEMEPEIAESASVPDGGFSVQVAALVFKDFEGFESLAAELKEKFPDAIIYREVSEVGPEGARGEKLLINHFEDKDTAAKFARKLKKLGYKGCFPVNLSDIEAEVY